jgi:uncharacterized PurR-regulated membrane protein YhhQ (DUF165 family)
MSRMLEMIIAIIIASLIASLIDIFVLEKLRRRLYCNS